MGRTIGALLETAAVRGCLVKKKRVRRTSECGEMARPVYSIVSSSCWMRGTAASHRDPGKSDAQEDGASIQKGKGESETACEQERRGIDVELPLQVRAHLSFHLIDLPESKHALARDTPRLVGIGVRNRALNVAVGRVPPMSPIGGAASDEERRR